MVIFVEKLNRRVVGYFGVAKVRFLSLSLDFSLNSLNINIGRTISLNRNVCRTISLNRNVRIGIHQGKYNCRGDGVLFSVDLVARRCGGA